MVKPRLEARKAVVFNVADEDDRALWEYASRSNFSQLVRRYLAADMKKQATVARTTITVQRGDGM